jgi:hypothetical protein
MYTLFPTHLAGELQCHILRMMPERVLWMVYTYFSDARAHVDANPTNFFSLNNRSCAPYRIMSESIYEGYVFRGERRRLLKFSVSTMSEAIYKKYNRVVQQLMDSNQKNEKYVQRRMLFATADARNKEALQIIIQHPSTQARMEKDAKFKSLVDFYGNVDVINMTVGEREWEEAWDNEWE